MEWRRDQFTLTDDPTAIDVDFVESMLRSSYWAADRPRSVIEASIDRSVNFIVLHDDHQVGYARVVTDGTTFAWIADVVVAPEMRGRGLGKWLMECILDHPSIKSTTQKMLRTRDAHGLYRRFGFEVAACMNRRDSQRA